MPGCFFHDLLKKAIITKAPIYYKFWFTFCISCRWLRRYSPIRRILSFPILIPSLIPLIISAAFWGLLLLRFLWYGHLPQHTWSVPSSDWKGSWTSGPSGLSLVVGCCHVTDLITEFFGSSFRSSARSNQPAKPLGLRTQMPGFLFTATKRMLKLAWKVPKPFLDTCVWTALRLE